MVLPRLLRGLCVRVLPGGVHAEGAEDAEHEREKKRLGEKLIKPLPSRRAQRDPPPGIKYPAIVFYYAGNYVLCSASSHEGEHMIMKRILFAGDSITKGELGCGYLPLIAQQFPSFELVNLGRDGDTVFGIMNRTISHLRKDSRYDLIVIAAGHNDIILSDFMEKSKVHVSIVKNLKKKGSIAASDYNEFVSTYTELIRSVRDILPSPIILTTLSCLNEDLLAPTNEKRSLYNQGIRKIASEHNLRLADIAEEFDSVLKESTCRDYFMNSLFTSLLFDQWKSKTQAGADKLSKKRSLNLTIDGIHLNSRGAEIYAKLLTAGFDMDE